MKKFELPKQHLLFVNGIIWLAIGLRIILKGLMAYARLWPDGRLPWMVALSVLVFLGFFFMFRRIVKRYTNRILSFEESRKHIGYTFSLRGYILIAFMISLGILFNHLPFIDDVFFSTFYTGLGGGLISAGIRFFVAWRKALRTP